ncbi:ATP-binding cassette domain-containing protein [Propioniciclava sp. MC1683]|uniref:iron ABC transporter ATP-binding protein n=1 Tax=Propioniciclava sp. MC1683 TaxID=2760309 RepID=UPI001601F9F1|nr:ATP-binding cassette domain-containing protein [Propioniciclava sp. MC1683]MBB1501841.1 ATP-binding cassette domain-containing protein [Propioniciclava sp. MC1683]
MIISTHVSAAYGETVVVDDVSILVPKGGVTALVGPNGAGKSTLLAVMARLMGAKAGTVSVDGLDVATTPSDVLAKRLAILKQDNHPGIRLTVRDLVGFGRYPHSRGRLTDADRAHVEQAMGWLDLEGLGDRFLDELSGGQRQRAFVAMVLAQDTDYILLDEPLNNLDMAHAVAMMKLLRRAADELDRTFVVVLHDLNAAAVYSDHMVAMADGKVVAAGKTHELMNDDLLSRVFGLPISVQDVAGRRQAVFYTR